MDKQQIETFCFEQYTHIDKNAPTAEHIHHHIMLVRKWTKKLCQSYPQVDAELLDIAAIAHDIGRRFGGEGHAVKSVEMISPFIADLPKNDQEIINESILKHGGKWIDEHNSVEVKILQSADAISIFDDPEMLAYARQKFSKEKFEAKLNKKFKKAAVLPEGKRYAEELMKEHDIYAKVA